MITDIIVPGAEGMETIYALRTRWPQIRILAISGSGRRSDYDYLETAQKLGADATLAKPFGRATLVEAVRALLQV